MTNFLNAGLGFLWSHWITKQNRNPLIITCWYSKKMFPKWLLPFVQPQNTQARLTTHKTLWLDGKNALAFQRLRMGTGGHHKGLQLLLHQPLGQPLQLAVTEEAVAVNVAAGKQNQHGPAVRPARRKGWEAHSPFMLNTFLPPPQHGWKEKKNTAGMSLRH